MQTRKRNGRDVSTTVLLETDVSDCFEEHYPVLGGASCCPRVHREQLCVHLWCGVLHHEVVDFFGIFISPFLLIMCMVALPLPFCCFDKVGWICWVLWEDNGWLLELANS
jgi:hypothetical protein